MTMVQATLATALANMVPTEDEAAAIQEFADAYEQYALDATALTPILPAGVTLGKNAMIPAMTGISTPGQGAQKMVDGIVAFWGGVAGGLTTSFAAAIAITPPPHASLLAALPPIFASNTSGGLSLSDSMNAIAAPMHANAIVGGTVTTPGGPPVVTPII
jgi:hypothetical protein